MSPVAHIKKSAWHFGCLAFHVLNFILAFTALALGSLIILNRFQQEVPLPDKLARWVINVSGPDFLEASWSKAVFDLRGGIYLTDLKVRDTETDQIILTAEATYMEWSPINLVIPGLPALEELNARNIQFYVPVSHSPTGLNEPALGVQHVFLRQSEGQLILSSLLLESGGLRLHATGHAPIQALMRPSGRTTERQSLYPALQVLKRLPDSLQADISAKWSMLPSGDHAFSLSGYLPMFTHDHVQMDKISARASGFLSSSGFSLRSLTLNGILTYTDALPEVPLLQFPEDPVPVPFRLTARGQPWLYGEFELPSEVNLFIHPKGSDLHFQHLILSTTLCPSLNNPVTWTLRGPSAFVSGLATFSDSPSGQFKAKFPSLYSFRSYLPNWSIYKLLPAPLPHRLLVGTKADSLRINASFDLSTTILSGSVSTDGLNIGQTDFQHLSSSINLSKSTLLLDDIFIQKAGDEFAQGAYWQDFPSTQFSLNAAGNIFPTSLDSILGNWWTNIFTHIHASQPLAGDVTVWGHWKREKPIFSMTGVKGPGASYRGVKIPHMELRVRSRPDWAYVEHLHASFPDGEILGQIGIQSGMTDADRYRAYTLDLSSTAKWDAVIGATGIKGLRNLSFKGENPHLEAKGTLWRDSGKGWESREEARIELSLLQHDGICHLKGMDLSGLALSGKLEGPELEIGSLSGKFAEGVFTGRLGLLNWQVAEETQYRIELNLLDASYGQAKRQLSDLLGFKEDASPLEAGRLDTSLSLLLHPDPQSTSGQGRISIREANLGTIRLFGGLSSVLGGMGLKFASVKMDAFTADWKVENRVMTVSNGHVASPSLNLTLNGTMDLETKNLNMVSELTLFTGLFSKVLAPVSETMQLDLSGPFENPNWKIRFNPFRWALNRLSTPTPSPGGSN
jgi:hypothetical protein